MTKESRAAPRGVVGQIARIRERANRILEGELAARSIKGVLPAHGAVFACLFQADGPVPIKEVVTHVGRVKSTVTGMLNNLESNGYISRTTSPEDRRSSLISLTARGLAFREDFDAVSQVLQERLYGRMPRKDRQQLVDLLSQLETNLAQEGDEEE